MKTLNLKQFLPVAVIAVALGGAFTTTSMQIVSESAPKNGFTRNANNKCTEVQVNCDTTPQSQLCRVSGTSGAIAYDKVGNNDCIQPLYRPF